MLQFNAYVESNILSAGEWCEQELARLIYRAYKSPQYLPEMNKIMLILPCSMVFNTATGGAVMLFGRFTKHIGLMLSVVLAWLLGMPIFAIAQDVNITQDLPAFEIKIGNKVHRIDRIQDTSNRLTNSFSKTSRKCPPFCIHPMKAAPGIETVGELELLDFLKGSVEPGEGLLIDARIAKFFEKGTIPGAVNIPFTLFSPDENPFIDKIRAVLGGTKGTDGNWNFDNALKLMLFCNGPWCDQSPRALRNLLAAGYPENKLFYYRGGMQNWQNLGLTIEVPNI